MKTILTLLLTMTVFLLQMQPQLSAQGVKWEESYTFDKCNVFKMEVYAKQNELMGTMEHKAYYQSAGKNFYIIMGSQNKNTQIETVFDLKNEVAIQIFGNGSGEPLYNAGGFKYPAAEDLKRLEVLPASETRIIAGYNCKKYTYTYKKIFGSVWITDQVNLPNDYGVFRACKMSAKHNTLSVDGFVMEMIIEDAKGGKTIMTTVSLKNNVSFTRDFRNVKMGTAINKINYYTF